MNGGDVDDTIKIACSCLAEYNNSLPLSIPLRSLMTADKQVDELILESDTSGWKKPEMKRMEKGASLLQLTSYDFPEQTIGRYLY